MYDMEAIDSALKELNQLAATDRPKLPEALFVRDLLPMLVNRDQIPDLDLTVWLDIAGNPHRAIDVVDAKNEVLFTVPPILSRLPSIHRGLDENSTSVSEIAYIYGEKAKAEHPAAADAWFEHALRKQNIPAMESQVLEYLRQWVKIYTRYGISTERLLGKDFVVSKERLKDLGHVESAPDTELSGEFDDF